MLLLFLVEYWRWFTAKDHIFSWRRRRNVCQSRVLIVSVSVLGRTHTRPSILCPSTFDAQILYFLTSMGSLYHAKARHTSLAYWSTVKKQRGQVWVHPWSARDSKSLFNIFSHCELLFLNPLKETFRRWARGQAISNNRHALTKRSGIVITACHFIIIQLKSACGTGQDNLAEWAGLK